MDYISIVISQWASLAAQLVRNLPAMWETWVQSLGWEDLLEKGKATHSSTLAWKIPWTLLSMGSKESDTTERLSLSKIQSSWHLLNTKFLFIKKKNQSH